MQRKPRSVVAPYLIMPHTRVVIYIRNARMCVHQVPAIYNCGPSRRLVSQFTGRHPPDTAGGRREYLLFFLSSSINLRHGFSPTSGAWSVTMEATKKPSNWFRINRLAETCASANALLSSSSSSSMCIFILHTEKARERERKLYA